MHILARGRFYFWNGLRGGGLGPVLGSHILGLLVGIVFATAIWWQEVGTDVRELRLSGTVLILLKNGEIERKVPLEAVISVRLASRTGIVTDTGAPRSRVVEIEVRPNQGEGSSWVTVGSLRWFGYDGIDAVHEAIAKWIVPEDDSSHDGSNER